MTILALAFVGRKNSGKTQLLEKLVGELTQRGYRVGTLKHHGHPGFDIDVEGKDSWRLTQAGSRFSVISAPDKIAMVRQLDAPEDAANTIAAMLAISAAGADAGTGPLDIVLVEGYRNSGLPTVELFRAANPNDAERQLDATGSQLVAVVTDMARIKAAAKARFIACFDFDDIKAIAAFVEDISGLKS